MEQFTYTSVKKLSEAIKSKKISSEELVKAHLERIDQINPKLNAVVALNSEVVLKRAKEADASLAKGEVWGPLHGVPMTIKDSLETAGLPCTAGTLGRAKFIPSKDATVVSRLRKAGAILMGKTNTPEFTWYAETDNLVYGRTNNPYDLSLTPGGSSGGAGAIISSGGSPFDLGSDTYGSIRMPAHFCGIAGIKPTSGRVPRTGHFPPPGGPMDWVTQIGPMARYVEDLNLILPIISGPDGYDPGIYPVPYRDMRDVKLNEVKIAFYTDNGIRKPEPEVVEVVNKVTQFLSEQGFSIREAKPKNIERSYAILTGLFGSDGGVGARMLLQMAGTAEKDLSPFLQYAFSTFEASRLTLDQFNALYFEADEFKRNAVIFMQDYDLIICPPIACIAGPHGTMGAIYDILSYTTTYNLLGWPAAVVRAGTSPSGLPVGVQIVAKPWCEDVALAMAKFIEEAFGGWQKPNI